MILSWGDIVGDARFKGAAQLDTPERVAAAARDWKAHGVARVIFRVDDFRLLLFHKLHYKPGGDYGLWAETTRKDGGVVPAAVRAARKEGLPIQMWVSVFDEGCPPEMLYQDSRPFPWQSIFSRENPRFLSCDRSLTASGAQISVRAARVRLSGSPPLHAGGGDSLLRVFDDITLRYDGQERAEAEKQFLQALESIPGVTGYVVDGRPLSLPVTESSKR